MPSLGLRLGIQALSTKTLVGNVPGLSRPKCKGLCDRDWRTRGTEDSHAPVHTRAFSPVTAWDGAGFFPCSQRVCRSTNGEGRQRSERLPPFYHILTSSAVGSSGLGLYDPAGRQHRVAEVRSTLSALVSLNLLLPLAVLSEEGAMLDLRRGRLWAERLLGGVSVTPWVLLVWHHEL